MTPDSSSSPAGDPSPSAGDRRIPVAVLGATGTVGARLVQRLERHPWFRLAEVAASERSEGARLRDRVSPDIELSAVDAERTLVSLDGPFRSHLVLSALPASAAREIEPELAARGHLVVSNASAFRADPGVPLIVPEVNPDHLDMVDHQAGRWTPTGGPARDGGGIVTNPNCAVAGLAPVLAPLDAAFGLRRVVVTTFQAISGAGRPGPSAIDLVDNVVPWIGGEEEKIEAEPRKILGRLVDGAIEGASLTVSATATRVPVLHGHLEAVSVELDRTATVDEATAVWRAFRAPEVARGLPSGPEQPIVVLEQDDRPQPRLDRDRAEGMAISVGRVRPCPVHTLRFLVLSHNLERGAAGAAMLNAELAQASGRVRPALG
ncbi:aspartate-semialdehyde dehydrogenase [Gemmatimonadota bacterium DH-20]|uniref:Aspartate-semialdehyde dehydrogenase n=1 Tax=Gaopeijia maritima TaxID=3119007 RepID=A0ABU9EBG2_9BACT